jgi:hypothetical protein
MVEILINLHDTNSLGAIMTATLGRPIFDALFLFTNGKWIVSNHVWLAVNLVPEAFDENPRLPLGSA